MSVHLQQQTSPGRSSTAPYVLPRLLAPLPHESLPGFILRYAELYRYWEPRRLLTKIGADDLILWTLCQEDPDGDVGSKLGSLLAAAMSRGKAALGSSSISVCERATISANAA